MPVKSVMYSGIGLSGFTKLSNSAITSPPLTFTAPISVMAEPDLGEGPVVSRSTIKNMPSLKFVSTVERYFKVLTMYFDELDQKVSFYRCHDHFYGNGCQE
ncbi:unannotated protein [freshwater metagenome]|uniref:Unannotated protein n=1 Tax=freshwater metagenome TaxID=449393 RepID=A0A6J6D8A1_9ZZZZ